MFLSVAIGFCLLPALTNAWYSPKNGPKYWFSFGDSYTQTGFNTTGTLPVPSNPLGNPPYPGWTATGGENWVDYVTTTYNNSLLLTYNYAYGGATINATLVPPYMPTVLSLIDQVDIYVSTAASHPLETPWKSKNSLFSIWIGINDIGNSWYLSGDRDAFADLLLNDEFGQVDRLYQTGARNFLFVNVPPINRSPYMILNVDEPGRETQTTVIDHFNAKMKAKALEFAKSDPEINVYFWDSWTSFTVILDDPESYGFVTDEIAYGSDPSNFWGNDYHPSSYAHKYFGEEVGTESLGDTIW